MRIKPIFAWYDLWIGAFYDKAKRRLYIFPVPCFGVMIQFRKLLSTHGDGGGECTHQRESVPGVCADCGAVWPTPAAGRTKEG